MRCDKAEQIFEKRLNGGRISLEEGRVLYRSGLFELGRAAEKLTAGSGAGQRRVTFAVDRNISYTNVCSVGCDFCAFHARPGSETAFTLTCQEILEKVQELAALGGTQVLIQGGVHPDLSLDYYLEWIQMIRERFPGIHIHAFSAVELDSMSKKFAMPLRKLIRALKGAGLHSVPGGGAEILSDRVRKKISPRKLGADRWIEVMRAIHEAGLPSTATMVFGHEETLEERLSHLIRLRELQDQTRGFRAFIPWSFVPYGTPRMSALSPAGGADYLKTVAVARLMLDNVEHIQSGWLTEGLKLAQMALFFGCDDMGGTLLEDQVLEPTGVEIRTRREDLIRLIREAGFRPAQRNTDYEIIHDFN